MQGLLAEGKEGKRRLDRKMTDYDAARLKHLGHKSNPKPSKWRKGEDAEKVHNDMVAAQVHTMCQSMQHCCQRAKLSPKSNSVPKQCQQQHGPGMLTNQVAFLTPMVLD